MKARSMSTVDRPQPHVLPPLEAGQRLDQPTFHERYAAMPEKTRAELVEVSSTWPFPSSTITAVRISALPAGCFTTVDSLPAFEG